MTDVAIGGDNGLYLPGGKTVPPDDLTWKQHRVINLVCAERMDSLDSFD